jgi:glutathione S-transferase
MLILYCKPNCYYSSRVLSVNQQIGAELVLRDVTADPAAKAELLEKGGKTQTPYLEDTDRGVSMYESLAIIAYLDKYYSKRVASTVAAVPKVAVFE